LFGNLFYEVIIEIVASITSLIVGKYDSLGRCEPPATFLVLKGLTYEGCIAINNIHTEEENRM
jgi:hypothetical protein